MRIFLVTVRPPVSTGGRYFDSIWVRKENADERAEQLKCELQRSGYKVWRSSQILSEEWYVSVVEAHAADARIAE